VYPKHPDYTKHDDIQDYTRESMLHFIYKKNKELEERWGDHDKIAKASVRNIKHRKGIYSMNLEEASSLHNLDEETEGSIDPETLLMYGMEHDDYIQMRKISTEEQRAEADTELDILVEKLGYLDLRDFVALNKYILEAENHDNFLNRAKASFLNVAMKRMDRLKQFELKNIFQEIENEESLSKSEKRDRKISYMFDNISEAKELFYKYYYKIKEISTKHDRETMDDFDKYEFIIKNMGNDNVSSHKTSENPVLQHIKRKEDIVQHLQKKGQNPFYSELSDYMERIIKTYREERTMHVKLTSADIKAKMFNIMKKEGDFAYPNIDGLIYLSKYYVFFKKYHKIYRPTNLETERLMVYFNLNNNYFAVE
jgi:hypothetical protein